MSRNKDENGERSYSRFQSMLGLVMFVAVFLIAIAVVGVSANMPWEIPTNAVIITAVVAVIGVAFVALIFESKSQTSLDVSLFDSLKLGVKKDGRDPAPDKVENNPSKTDTFLPKTDVPFLSDILERHWEQAKLNLQNKDYEKAAEGYSLFTEEDPRYWDALVNKMICKVRCGDYDAALLIFDEIVANCENKKYLAQSYINKGDCLMGKAVSFPNLNLEIEACNCYQKAYQIDSQAITSVFYYWFAEKIRGNTSNAELLSHRVKNHKDLHLLNEEQIRYFWQYFQTENKFMQGELKMNWKKITLTGIFLLLLSLMASTVIAGVVNGNS